MAPHGNDEDTAVGCKRIREGFLNLWIEKGNKIKKRWVVFQGDSGTGIFQLKVFKKPNEKVLKIAYTVSKDTFVGIERGKRVASSKPGEKSATYLAFILVTATLLFEGDTATDLKEWHKAFETYFKGQSWEVVPMTGVNLPETTVVLHLTQNAISLVTRNPMKHYQRWSLGIVRDYGAWGARIYIRFDETDVHGRYMYLEMRASTPEEAVSISDSLNRLLPHLLPNTDRRNSLSSLGPEQVRASSSPRRMSTPVGAGFVVSAGYDRTSSPSLFNFANVQPPVSPTPHTGQTPPPVSPRPPSSLD